MGGASVLGVCEVTRGHPTLDPWELLQVVDLFSGHGAGLF